MFSALDNVLVDIDEVKARGLRGLLDDKYTCSGCGGKVVAKLGNKNVNHFAHFKIVSCDGNPMTNLHKVAEQIVYDNKSVFLPYCSAQTGISDEVIICTEQRGLVADKAFLELTDFITGKRPDVALWFDDRPIYVEIAVTSFCNEEKIQSYRDAGKECIEFDLSQVRRIITKNDLKKLILGSDCKPEALVRWLHHAGYSAALLKAEKDNMSKKMALKKKAEAENRAREVSKKKKVLAIAESKQKAKTLKAERRIELIAALDSRNKGLPISDWKQDMVWYYDVLKGNMKAIDWKEKRNAANGRCPYLDKELTKYAGEIAKESIFRRHANWEAKFTENDVKREANRLANEEHEKLKNHKDNN